MGNGRFAWITWERQQRNMSMARAVGADYYEFNRDDRGFFWRIVLNFFDTISVFRKNYEVIFVQNPSIVLSFISVIFKFIFSKRVVIDAHNAGVRPREGKSRILNIINDFILKSADLVIVSNAVLSSYLEAKKIKSFVMPDPIPVIDVELRYLQNPAEVFIICSWSTDEPIELYLEVARRIPERKFAITGNFRKYNKDLQSKIPSNLELLGFVPEKDYFSYLQASLITVDLTLREDCLVCGAYESVALGVPGILTDSNVNREIFTEGFCFSKLTIESLVHQVRNAFSNIDTLEKGIHSLKANLTAKENQKVLALVESVMV